MKEKILILPTKPFGTIPEKLIILLFSSGFSIHKLTPLSPIIIFLIKI